MKIPKYPLPSGEGSLGEKFAALCRDNLEIELSRVREHLRATVDHLVDFNTPLLYQNLRDATWVAERCHALLDSMSTLSSSDASLAMAAVRYFVVHVDSVPDLTPGIGFEDDRLIMSHVLERLGRNDLLLDYQRYSD